MGKPGNLTPDEMIKAVRLAAELYEQETEHKSMLAASEEVGVPPEYMARAMARIYAERQGKKSAARVWVQAAVAVICFVAIYWSAKSITRSVQSPVPLPTGAKQPVDFSQVPSGLAELMVPFGTGDKIITRGMNEQYPATVRFHNTLTNDVQIYQLDAHGGRHLTATVPALGVVAESTWFTHPWLISSGRDYGAGGVVYPAYKPSQVDIGPSSYMMGGGYLRPLPAVDAHPVYATSPGLATTIGVVNTTDQPAQLYRVALNGKREYIGTLAVGEAIFEPTYENERWVAKNREVDDMFKPDLNPATAVIESMDRYITNPPPIPKPPPLPHFH